MQLTASDRRIGNRAPWNIAQEAALQKSRIGVNRAGGRGRAPAGIFADLMEELVDLCGKEEAERLVGQAEMQTHKAA